MAGKLTGLFALCLGFIAHAEAAQAAPALPENAVLDKFVGTWQGDIEITSADGKKAAQTWRNTFAWALHGRFLRDEGGDTGGSASFLGLWSYDPGNQRYQSWYFLGPDGMVANLAYVWDAKSQTLTGKADIGAGMKIETVDRFIDKEHYDWSTSIRDKEGRPVQVITARQTRVH